MPKFFRKLFGRPQDPAAEVHPAVAVMCGRQTPVATLQSATSPLASATPEDRRRGAYALGTFGDRTVKRRERNWRLGGFGTGNYVYAVFRHARPDDEYREWWRLIRRFAGQVYAVQLPDIGRIPARVQRLQDGLGVRRLPPSLVEWIAFLGDLRRRSGWASEDLPHLRASSFPEHQAVSVGSTSVGSGWMQSGVALADLGRDDPPVNVYGYVAGRNRHVLRRSYPRFPLAQWALYTVVESAGSNYARMGSLLGDPVCFLRGLPESVPVSARFAGLRFVEGTRWFAYVRHGITPYGRENDLIVRFTEGAELRDIPEPRPSSDDLSQSTLG